jgi:hypothetical protein
LPHSGVGALGGDAHSAILKYGAEPGLIVWVSSAEIVGAGCTAPFVSSRMVIATTLLLYELWAFLQYMESLEKANLTLPLSMEFTSPISTRRSW